MRQLTHTWSSGLSNNQRDREGKVECQDPPGTASDERNEFPIALLREKRKEAKVIGEVGGSKRIFSWGVMGFLMVPVDPRRLLCPIVLVVSM